MVAADGLVGGDVTRDREDNAAQTEKQSRLLSSSIWTGECLSTNGGEECEPSSVGGNDCRDDDCLTQRRCAFGGHQADRGRKQDDVNDVAKFRGLRVRIGIVGVPSQCDSDGHAYQRSEPINPVHIRPSKQDAG